VAHFLDLEGGRRRFFNAPPLLEQPQVSQLDALRAPDHELATDTFRFP